MVGSGTQRVLHQETPKGTRVRGGNVFVIEFLVLEKKASADDEEAHHSAEHETSVSKPPPHARCRTQSTPVNKLSSTDKTQKNGPGRNLTGSVAAFVASDALFLAVAGYLSLNQCVSDPQTGLYHQCCLFPSRCQTELFRANDSFW